MASDHRIQRSERRREGDDADISNWRPGAGAAGARGAVNGIRVALLIIATTTACGGYGVRRFPMREPIWTDTDLRSVRVPCHREPTEKEPDHVSCSPGNYVSPLAWDGIDNSIFRPLADSFTLESEHEATNVNSLDEVPDSAWFTSRIGKRSMSIEEFGRGACDASLILDGENAKDGEWEIDQGKPNGSSPGFRIRVPGKGKYLLKSDGAVRERPTAASIIGAAAYNAVGFNTSCEQIVYVRASAFKLKPGLMVTDNTGVAKPFDEKALKKVLDGATPRGDLLRFQASAWLPGHLIGPFRYEKLREDDPNDVIPHQDRRELRGGRLLAAWLDHFDAREQNSMDIWIADNPSGPNDASPGKVIHYYLDTSDCFGSEWAWDGISRRLGHSYLLDWGHIGEDFVTLGLLTRPWELADKVPGMEIFGYYSPNNFEPEKWVNEYPNPAFSRMTEHDGAWMARILARFTPAMIHEMVRMGKFTQDAQGAYLEAVISERLRLILERYLLRLSPLAELEVEGGARLCAHDLAREAGLLPADQFHYAAESILEDGSRLPLKAEPRNQSEVCIELPRANDAARKPILDYVIVRITNGAATGPLDVHLYDLGPLGYRLAGLDRPDTGG